MTSWRSNDRRVRLDADTTSHLDIEEAQIEEAEVACDQRTIWRAMAHQIPDAAAWPLNLSDEDVLVRPFALNQAMAGVRAADAAVDTAVEAL